MAPGPKARVAPLAVAKHTPPPRRPSTVCFLLELSDVLAETCVAEPKAERGRGQGRARFAKGALGEARIIQPADSSRRKFAAARHGGESTFAGPSGRGRGRHRAGELGEVGHGL